jgi:hypothetical protein
MLPVNVWRYGRDKGLPVQTKLRAGQLTLIFEEGELRFIRYGNSEVINRIYVAVRDRNWDSAPVVLSQIKQELGEDSFRISFDAECRLREIDFAWKGIIEGESPGTVAFSMEGVARSTFMKNRIGFCVLHPDSYAGSPCTLFHPDGSSEPSFFPRTISPYQPFLDLSGISYEVSPGVRAELFFEGEVFETEDQRNWTDASFKTHCTPYSLPFPVEVSAGFRISQAITLNMRFEAARNRNRTTKHASSAASRASSRCFIEMKASPIGSLPPIGLCVASHATGLSARETAMLRALAPDHLRVDVDLTAPDWEANVRRASLEAISLDARLHVAVFFSDALEQELESLRVLFGRAKCKVALWLVFKSDESCTADRWVEMARKVLGPVFPSARFASGTNAHFAELNRGTPPGQAADCVVYSVNPQVHAFDNFSIMETLNGQASTVESSRKIAAGKPTIISPVTMKPRFNAVATGPLPPVPLGELPPEVDTRQMSLFGAAWTLGSVARLATAGAASLTYYETTGMRGVMETEAGPAVAGGFPALPGCVFPLYHVLCDLREMGSAEILPAISQPWGMLDGMTLQTRGMRRTMIANLRMETTTTTVRGILGSGRARLRHLDETTVEKACRSPEQYRRDPGIDVQARRGVLELRLGSYAVARIDWET